MGMTTGMVWRKGIGALAALALLMATLTACQGPRRLDRENSPEGIFERAELRFQARAHDEALQWYNTYLTRFPRGPHATSALMREGEIYRIGGKYDTARKVYSYLIQHFPDSGMVSDAAVGILISYFEAGDFKSLARHADDVMKAIQSPVQRSEAFRLLGDAYMALGTPVSAVYYYNQADQRVGYRLPENQEKLSVALSQLSVEDINVLLDRVREDSRLRGHLMYQLGVNYLKSNREADGASVLTEFIRSFPDHEKAGDARQIMAATDVMPIASRHTIGALLPMSGPYQLYGRRAMRGVELAMSRPEGPMGEAIHLVARDTGSEDEGAVAAFRSLIAEQPSAIIGPIAAAEAVAREAQIERIPIIALTQKEGIAAIGDYVFRNFITPQMQVDALISHAMGRLGLFRFAILYPEEKYGHTFMDLFAKSVNLNGGTLVGAVAYDINQTDFRNPIRELSRLGGFDALFIPDAPRKAGLIVPQLAFYDMRRAQLLGTNLWHAQEMLDMAGKHVEGAVMPTGFFPESAAWEVADFVHAFEAAYGEKPGFIEAIAYDTARILIRLLGQPDIRYKSALKDALASLDSFPGVTGLTAFDAGGECRKKLYLLQVRDGAFTDVSGRGGLAAARP